MLSQHESITNQVLLQNNELVKKQISGFGLATNAVKKQFIKQVNDHLSNKSTTDFL